MNANDEHSDSGSERLTREFASPDFEAWLERLSTQGFCRLLVSLILKLERMAQAPLDGARRVEILRGLMTLIRDLADDLPRNPLPRPPGGRKAAATPSLEQRLGAVTFKNLKRTLEELDQSGGAVLGEHDGARIWAVGEMFTWLGRQIERADLGGLGWPRQTWQELHDLFLYCTNRMGADGAAIWVQSGPQAADATLSDPVTAYKRLLMVGLCAEQGADALLVPAAGERFSTWVRAAELHDPAAYFGVLGTYLVEAGGDTPPRLVPGALGSVSRAKVLRLPPPFLAALSAAKAGRHPFGAD